MKLHYFLDSGAPTFYNKFSRGKAKRSRMIMGEFITRRRRQNFDWLEDPEFVQYKKDYYRFCSGKDADRYEWKAALDVINNPPETWRNWREGLAAGGKNVVPVWHFGSSLKWLGRICGASDRLAIGGIAPNQARNVCPFLDTIWRQNLKDKQVHGFATTSHAVALRYPWYSVDSTTWIKMAACGKIVVPIRRGGKWQTSTYVIRVSNDPKATNKYDHIGQKPKSHEDLVRGWCKEFGVDYEAAKDSYQERRKINLISYALPITSNGTIFFMTGKEGADMECLEWAIKVCPDLSGRIGLLESFFYLRKEGRM